MAERNGSREATACERAAFMATSATGAAPDALEPQGGDSAKKGTVAFAVNPGGAAEAPAGSSGRFSWEPLLAACEHSEANMSLAHCVYEK